MRPSPAHSPELWILLSAFEARRDQKGIKWCREHGVGAVRRALKTAPPNVVPIVAAAIPEVGEAIGSKNAAQAALREVCAACRGCEWAKR